jgi:cysteinyl-tRNA synthetase
MTISTYNTKTGKKEPLSTIRENHVNLYVCGITVYDYCHLGHARSTLVFDMIVRYLRYRGKTVTFIRNFTDIDDKIIRRAAEQNTTTEELSNRFIQAFHEDMESLGNLTPDLEPKATEHIPEIIELIQTLIAKGLAYEQEGDVYFRVEKFPHYGALSGRNLNDMLAGARIAVSDKKENPMDFVLWKSSKPGEPVWASPWGPGRPGWHIECSAMSKKYLGDTFDIHGGGKDLIFPHHENEIAQSEGASGKPFVNTWIHHGFVTIKDEKMSKSLGNFLTIREMLERYSAEVLRLFVFSAQYRTPLDFSDQAMQDAESGLDRLYSCLATVAALPTEGNGDAAIAKKDRQKLEKLEERFCQAMDNDFNTAQGLGHLFDAAKTINKITQHLPAAPSRKDLDFLRECGETMKRLGDLLGILKQEPVAYLEAKQQKVLGEIDITPQEIEKLIAERNKARDEKNWARADEIRSELLAKKIEIQDAAGTTTWQVKI